jgi:F-type H+-transporting ATPase subunit epsilon
MSEKNFSCSVVTPEREVHETKKATFVAFPAWDGEVGILSNRAPLLCQLGKGVLRIEQGKETLNFEIDRGFAQMVDNRLTLLTERATPV